MENTSNNNNNENNEKSFSEYISEKLATINENIENEKTGGATYQLIITEKNRVLKLNKQALEKLNENGVELENGYISYNKKPNTYNSIYDIVTTFSDIFTKKQ